MGSYTEGKRLNALRQSAFRKRAQTLGVIVCRQVNTKKLVKEVRDVFDLNCISKV